MFEKLTLKPNASNPFISSLATSLLLAAMLLGFNSIALGQGSYGADPTSFFGTVMQSTMSNANQIVQNQMMKKYLEESYKKKSTSTGQYGNTNKPSTTQQGKSPATAQYTSQTTIFKPVSSSSIMPRKVVSTQLHNNDPNKRQQNLEIMEMFLDHYAKTFQKGNAPKNDLAHALTFLISTSYVVMTGNKVEKEEFKSAYQQVQAVMLRSPKLPSMPEREKQEMYEAFIIMGSFPVFFTEVANDPAVKDEAKAKQLKKLAKEIAQNNLEKIFGSSYKNIRFTEYGIEF